MFFTGQSTNHQVKMFWPNDACVQNAFIAHARRAFLFAVDPNFKSNHFAPRKKLSQPNRQLRISFRPGAKIFHRVG